MKLTIDVTQEDIDLGCRKDVNGKSGGCMVWRAFNRCTEGAFPFVWIECTNILIYPSHDLMLDQTSWLAKDIPLPAELEGLIMDFDTGLPVQPFSFEIEIQEN